MRAHSLRAAVRDEVVLRQLEPHLPAPPGPAVDLGAGPGRLGIRLARRGFDVTLVDASARMVRDAEEARAQQPPDVLDRIELHHARAEDAAEILGVRRFALVCGHAVLPHVDDPAALLAAVTDLAAPGAVISVLFKNADALAMRAGLEGRFDDALSLQQGGREVAADGTVLDAHRLERVAAIMEETGLDVDRWCGTGILTVHRHDLPADATIATAVEAELVVGRRDPYRRVARLVHVLAHRPA